MEHFDLIIVGAGPGGYTAALEAAGLKKSVLLIEKDRIGGTCLNRGCIPTKALLHSSKLYAEAKNGEESGVYASDIKYDLASMCFRSRDVQKQLRDGIENLLKRGKVTICKGKSNVLTEHTVSVNGEIYEGDNILIATGSVPSVPPIKGLDIPSVVTSDDLLSGDGIDCKSLAIIGGGVVGVEFAQIYHNLGAEVTVVEALPRLLNNLDREFGQSLSMSFKKRGINVFTNALVEKLEVSEDGKTNVIFADKNGTQELSAGKVLVCTGRRPNTLNLFSAELEVKMGMQRGYIPVTENGQTAVECIYAVGDVVMGGIQLAHAAGAQAKNAVAFMFGNPGKKDVSFIPSCIFTDPEIACVGLTAEQAKEKGIEAKTKKNLSTSNGKAIIEGAERGFVKLVYRSDDHILLGAQMMCPHASEMIGGLTVMIRSKLTIEQVVRTVFPHPTVSEVIGE